LSADGANRPGRDKQVENCTDAQGTNKTNGYVSLGIFGFFGGCGDSVETHISKED